METGENKPKYKWKNIHVGTNPITGKPYFERRKVEIADPTEPPPEPEAPPPPDPEPNAQVPSSHKQATYTEDPYWTK